MVEYKSQQLNRFTEAMAPTPALSFSLLRNTKTITGTSGLGVTYQNPNLGISVKFVINLPLLPKAGEILAALCFSGGVRKLTPSRKKAVAIVI